MTEREINQLVCTLAVLQRDLACCQKRVETLYARYARDAHNAHDAHVEGVAKETKERDIPPTPPIEKENKEKLRTDRLIDCASRRDQSQSIAPEGCDVVLEKAAKDAAAVQGGRLEPTEAEVITFATNAMGVPRWFAVWWHRYMTAVGWTTNRGERIDRRNWRPLLMTWWRNCREDEREQIRREITERPQRQETVEEARARLKAEHDKLFGNKLED